MLLSILVINIIHIIAKKIVSVDYNEYDLGRPRIALTFDFKDRLVPAFIYFNTFISYTVLDTDHVRDLSFKDREKKVLGIQWTYECFLFNIGITLNSDYLSNFNIYVAQVLINFFGLKGIGLGYKIEDESFSLVHQLYKNNKIDHLSFAFEDRERNGTVHFGGIPNDAHLKMPYKGYINIDESLPTWGGHFESISYNGNKMKINVPFIINSAVFDMFYSEELYNILLDNVFKDLIKKNLCKAHHEIIYYLECTDDISLNSNIIEFTFSNMTLSLPIKDLFYGINTPKRYSLFEGKPSKTLTLLV